MSITQRIDAVTKIADKYIGTILPPPKSVKVELTAACPYRCSFCVKSIRPDNGEMDRRLYSRLLREMVDAGVTEVGLFYIGEPFASKWLAEAVAEAKQAGIEYVFLTTNGSLCTDANLQAVMAAGLDSLKFSVNFYSADQLSEVAQVSGRNFTKALSAIQAARRIRDAGGYRTKIYASSIAFDGEQGEKMQAVVESIKPYCDEHYWLPLFPMDGATKANGMKPGPGNPGRLGAMRDPLPCWAVTTGHVTKDGLLSACCFGAGIEGSLIMADLKETSFLEGWNSPKFQELRRAHFAKDVRGTPCESCVAGG